MRLNRTAQPRVFQPHEVVHLFAEPLERASEWLDEHPELLDMVGACVAGSLSCGRHGLTCETILRCAVLMHLRGYSYRQLEFALADSASARVDPWHPPKKSALQSAIGALDAATWQALNGLLVQDAKQRGIESGTQVRIDSTATDADILEPSDSRLLYDGVRVLTGLLREAHKRLAHVVVRDHCRAAKRREREIGSQRDPKRRAAGYRRLLRLVGKTVGYAEDALADVRCVSEPWAKSWCTQARSYLALIERVVQQTERRVFDGETVPAAQKVVSLFESHADIIVKGGRQTHYGHKINLSTGRSALVLDVVVEDGNPADSTHCDCLWSKPQLGGPPPLGALLTPRAYRPTPRYRDRIVPARELLPSPGDRSIRVRLPTTTHRCGRGASSVLAAARGRIAVNSPWSRPSQRIPRPGSTFDRGGQARRHSRR